MSEPSLFAHVVQHKLATWRLDLPHLVRLCVERFAPPIGNTLNHYLTYMHRSKSIINRIRDGRQGRAAAWHVV